MTLPQKVILLGPMGAGKSTLGKILSAKLNWPYIDNDLDMAKQTGMSIAELSSLSVADLHKIEAEFINKVLTTQAPFISGAAASVIENLQIRNELKQVCAIYLSIPVETAIERASAGSVGRQALTEEGVEILRERYKRRDPLYREVATFVINLSNSPEADAEKILNFLDQG
jgi:shikimate kinase